MAKKVGHGHYLAAPMGGGGLGYTNGYSAGYWTDGEESQRTDRTPNGEYYTVLNERAQVMPKAPDRRHRSPHKKSSDKLHVSSPNLRASLSTAELTPSGRRDLRSLSASSLHGDRRRHNHHHHHHDDSGSEIYVTSAAFRAPSQLSRNSRQSRYSRHTKGGAPSEISVRSKVSRKGGVVVETMSAPNPFCPNTKGCCCLLLLLNLGLILITLGFVIVLQFYEPVFVWVLGIVFLIFGFIALNVSLIYCVSVCKNAKSPKQVAMEDHYWTKHWQKNFGLPEIHYSGTKTPADPDRYSDLYSVGTKDRPRY